MDTLSIGPGRILGPQPGKIRVPLSASEYPNISVT